MSSLRLFVACVGLSAVASSRQKNKTSICWRSLQGCPACAISMRSPSSIITGIGGVNHFRSLDHAHLMARGVAKNRNRNRTLDPRQNQQTILHILDWAIFSAESWCSCL